MRGDRLAIHLDHAGTIVDCKCSDAYYVFEVGGMVSDFVFLTAILHRGR